MLISTTLETLIKKAIDRAYAAGKQATIMDDPWDSALPWYLDGNRSNGMPNHETKKIIKEVFYDYQEE